MSVHTLPHEHMPKVRVPPRLGVRILERQRVTLDKVSDRQTQTLHPGIAFSLMDVKFTRHFRCVGCGSCSRGR